MANCCVAFGALWHWIEKGDSIVFETKDDWCVYKVYAILLGTSEYNVKVLAPVPNESRRKKPGRYITLTSCTPRKRRRTGTSCGGNWSGWRRWTAQHSSMRSTLPGAHGARR
ncbi:hypothetical protein GCM10010344_58830 [Streptomyces bluensis]|nr:hypothetical protein GCM10010344_58830 [Streptomyces bluensis]